MRHVEGNEFRSGDALFTFDDELVVRSWNRAAEELVGVPAPEAIGRRCWEILGGVEPDGALVCHKDCPYVRLARDGWPVAAHDVVIKGKGSRRRVTLSTITCAREGGLFLHLMRPAERPVAAPTAGLSLTPRQLQVLELLADGLPAKTVAARLGIAVATVRNHIREILRILDAHSQLEAIARARRDGLLRT